VGLGARGRWWRYVAASSMGAAIVVCRSRGVWLALGGATLVVALLQVASGRMRRAPRGLLAAVALGVVLGAAVPWPGLAWRRPLADSASRVFEYDAGSGRDRVDQALVGWSLARSAPWFGVGAAGWFANAPAHVHAAPGRHIEFLASYVEPNADLVRVAAERGGVGALAYVALYLALLGAGLRAAWRGRGSSAAALPTACVFALVVAGGVSLVDAPAATAPIAPLVAIIAGLVLAGDAESRADAAGAQTAGLARRWRIGAVAVGTLASALIGVRFIAQRRFFARFDVAGSTAASALAPLPLEDLQLVYATRPDAAGCAAVVGLVPALLREFPNEIPLYGFAARCAADAGQATTARRLLTTALGIEPHAPYLRVELERLGEAAGP
jgi:hypothetical protein